MLKSHKTHVTSQTNVNQKPKERERDSKVPTGWLEKRKTINITKIQTFGTSKTILLYIHKVQVKIFPLWLKLWFYVRRSEF